MQIQITNTEVTDPNNLLPFNESISINFIKKGTANSSETKSFLLDL